MAALLSYPDLLARLVGFDSTSRNSNRPIAEFIADYLARPGIRVESHPGPEGDKVNLAIFVGPETDGEGRGLVLSGHTDVVPADEPDWTSDPFVLTDAGDRWVGRGACDMKGFVALAVDTAARLDPAGLRHPLVLILTCDEELGCVGARHFAATWREPERLPKSAIIGEPTSLAVVRMHKGHLKMRLTCHGRPAHSAYPHLGDNAIEAAGEAIAALVALRRELARERDEASPFFPDVPFVTLNLARIQGGGAINVVPERCTLDLGARVLPGMAAEPFLARVEEAARRAVAGRSLDFEFLGDSKSLLLAEDAPVYRALTEITGQRETQSVHYGTDGGWLSTLGLDCAVFGPGTIEVAHKPDEWLPKAELERAAGIVDRMIQRFCR